MANIAQYAYLDEDSRSELSSCPSDYADSDSSFSVVPETDNEVEEEIWEEEGTQLARFKCCSGCSSDAHADGFVEEEPVNDDQSSGQSLYLNMSKFLGNDNTQVI